MKTLTILSGKGGVGKSSISASLAILLARKRKIVAVDCDVDTPNLGLVLGLRESRFNSWKKIKTNVKAKLMPQKCTGQKKCLDICNFGAISWDGKKPVINRFLCEGCGTCSLVCPEGAIKLEEVQNAKIGTGRTEYGFSIVSGQLKMGESGSGKIVTAVRDRAEKLAKQEKAKLMLIDSAAGIGCPVIASVRGSNFIIAVTEPNPAAINDLKRALQVVRHFNIPCGIIINKSDLNIKLTKKIEEFAREQKIVLLGKIGYDKAFVEALVQLKPIIIHKPEYECIFSGIAYKVEKYLN